MISKTVIAGLIFLTHMQNYKLTRGINEEEFI